MFGGDGFVGDERFALSEVVDGRHSELVLFAVIQPGDVEARRAAEPADRRPDARLLVLLLDNVVTDRPTARVLLASTHVSKFCSLAVLDPRVGHTMDVLSPFISALCHSDRPFHGESCPRLDVDHPGHGIPMVFLACVHLALFLALSLSPVNSLVSS